MRWIQFLCRDYEQVNFFYLGNEMKEAVLKRSTNPKKKYMVVMTSNDRKKTIHFGAKGYSDYTKHKDPERKKRYDTRHKANEDWKDPFSAGFWAKWILWNKPTIRASIADTTKRFRIKISISE
jgi:hypothetical protein